MIVELGHFALCLALVASVVQASVPLWGTASGSPAAMKVADTAAQVHFLGAALAFAALTWAFVVSDFSVTTVAMNSHSTKPMLYKVSGVWANHEGSMLLWVLMLALFGVLISVFGSVIPVVMRATVLAVQAMVGIARQFGMFTVVESVEEPKAAFLTAVGVDCLQGYLYGAPTLKPTFEMNQPRRKAG